MRRLLDHTSGILGFTEFPEFDILGPAYNPTFPRDFAYALIRRHPFQFPTGMMQVYNYSAFWLAGVVMEKASGKIALSVNGSPARPYPWVEGWTFREGAGTIVSFRRSGEGGPATELRYMVPGAHLVLKRQ